MCDPVTATVMAVTAATANVHEQDKAYARNTRTQRLNQHERILQANRQDADSALADVDARDEAQRKLTEVNLRALRNQGTINTAVGESSLSGNSMDRIRRTVANQASGEKMNITDNFNRDSAARFQKRLGAVENARSAVRGMGGRRTRTSVIDNILKVTGAGASGYVKGLGALT